MATQTLHLVTGEILQDGLTAAEWLEEMFEYELCPECEQDADEHEVRLDILGLFHAWCLRELDE